MLCTRYDRPRGWIVIRGVTQVNHQTHPILKCVFDYAYVVLCWEEHITFIGWEKYGPQYVDMGIMCVVMF